MEEKDDQDVKRRENADEKEVDRPPADQGADVQKIILEDTEVKNNSPEMTPELQLKAQSIAIEVSIKRLMKK